MSITANAQLKDIDIKTQADTLIINTSSSSLGEDSWADLFKGSDGYLFKMLLANRYNSRSTNSEYLNNTSFFNNPTFYIGETNQEAIATINELVKLCKNDVATSAEVRDFKGNSYHISTATALYLERSQTYVESDRLFIWNNEMEEPIILLKKTMEEALKFLKKRL
jgi:hypothetical protein